MKGDRPSPSQMVFGIIRYLHNIKALAEPKGQHATCELQGLNVTVNHRTRLRKYERQALPRLEEMRTLVADGHVLAEAGGRVSCDLQNSEVRVSTGLSCQDSLKRMSGEH